MLCSWRDKVVVLRDRVPCWKLLPSWWARFFSKNRLIIWLLCSGQYFSLSWISIWSNCLGENVRIEIDKSSLIDDNKSFRKLCGVDEITEGLALLRSKGSNVNKPFDIGIIISSVSYHKSAI
jgi:hypothetical protein